MVNAATAYTYCCLDTLHDCVVKIQPIWFTPDTLHTDRICFCGYGYVTHFSLIWM